MNIDVTLESHVPQTPRTLQVGSLFDLPVQEKMTRSWSGTLPIEGWPWSVGLIVGPSGSGKSTIARQVWGEAVIQEMDWPDDLAVVDAFPAEMGIKEIVGHLTSVGLGSVPTWVRPHSQLSTGEQFRATLALALARSHGLTVIDEFTSVVDRQVAQVASHSLQKAVRRQGTQVVCVTCHSDVIEWLQPDWIFQPGGCVFTRRDMGRRPPFHLDVYPVDRSAWSLFRPHHYLSGNLNASARCFGGFTELGECVAFASYVHFPHPRAKDIKMAHRLVVLPDYQGLGLGVAFSEWSGEHVAAQGFRFRTTISHPGLIAAYSRSPRWRLVGGQASKHVKARPHAGTRGVRHAMVRTLQTRSFEYVPIGSAL